MSNLDKLQDIASGFGLCVACEFPTGRPDLTVGNESYLLPENITEEEFTHAISTKQYQDWPKLEYEEGVLY